MSTYERVIAIDPGRTSGWARYVGHRLQDAGTFAEQAYPLSWAAPSWLVIEVPRIYPGGRGKGDPNGLIQLALTVGEIRGHYRARGCRIVETFPSMWKGQTPKEIHHARVLAKLDAQELRALDPHRRRATKTNPHGYDHNLLDAVALGLWFLER